MVQAKWMQKYLQQSKQFSPQGLPSGQLGLCWGNIGNWGIGERLSMTSGRDTEYEHRLCPSLESAKCTRMTLRS